MKIQLLQNRVLVEPDAMEEVSEGGIIIPGDSKKLPTRGIVVAVAKGSSKWEVSSKVGDRVLFGKYAGNEFPFEGKEYLMMRQTDIEATL